MDRRFNPNQRHRGSQQRGSFPLGRTYDPRSLSHGQLRRGSNSEIASSYHQRGSFGITVQTPPSGTEDNKSFQNIPLLHIEENSTNATLFDRRFRSYSEQKFNSKGYSQHHLLHPQTPQPQGSVHYHQNSRRSRAKSMPAGANPMQPIEMFSMGGDGLQKYMKISSNQRLFRARGMQLRPQDLTEAGLMQWILRNQGSRMCKLKPETIAIIQQEDLDGSTFLHWRFDEMRSMGISNAQCKRIAELQRRLLRSSEIAAFFSNSGKSKGSKRPKRTSNSDSPKFKLKHDHHRDISGLLSDGAKPRRIRASSAPPPIGKSEQEGHRFKDENPKSSSQDNTKDRKTRLHPTSKHHTKQNLSVRKNDPQSSNAESGSVGSNQMEQDGESTTPGPKDPRRNQEQRSRSELFGANNSNSSESMGIFPVFPDSTFRSSDESNHFGKAVGSTNSNHSTNTSGGSLEDEEKGPSPRTSEPDDIFWSKLKLDAFPVAAEDVANEGKSSSGNLSEDGVAIQLRASSPKNMAKAEEQMRYMRRHRVEENMTMEFDRIYE